MLERPLMPGAHAVQDRLLQWASPRRRRSHCPAAASTGTYTELDHDMGLYRHSGRGRRVEHLQHRSIASPDDATTHLPDPVPAVKLIDDLQPR